MIVIEKIGINQLYVTPSNIHTFMIEGEEAINRFALKSLKVIGSGKVYEYILLHYTNNTFTPFLVGEPLNQDAYWWFYNTVGKGRCHVIDTWWQTGT